MNERKVNSHVHGRIAKLAQRAFDTGLIVHCNFQAKDNTYSLQKNGEFLPTEYNPIATGSILFALLSEHKERNKNC